MGCCGRLCHPRESQALSYDLSDGSQCGAGLTHALLLKRLPGVLLAQQLIVILSGPIEYLVC
jgi:hypothetical protein